MTRAEQVCKDEMARRSTREYSHANISIVFGVLFVLYFVVLFSVLSGLGITLQG